MSNSINLMSEKSDADLIAVLVNRADYESQALDAAIEEAIKRKIITDLFDLEIKYPLMVDDFPKQMNEKELQDFKDKKDFIAKKYPLFLIGVIIFLVILIIKETFPVMPVIYMLLVFYCSKHYKKLLATIIFWLAAFQIVAIIFWLISLLFV